MSSRDLSEDDRVPVLATTSTSQFRPLKTIPVFSIHLLISTAISLTGIILAIKLPNSKRCEAYFTMLYLRAAFWFITLIINMIVKYHHEKLLLNGYIDFHKSMKVHKAIPFYVVTLWNNVIMFIQILIHHYYGENFAEHCIEGFFSPFIYITLFHITESFFLYIIIGSYIARVCKFNKSKLPPDALSNSFNDNSGSVGIAHSQVRLQELVEKQADIISYLKDHNANLNKKLILLNAEIKLLRGEFDRPSEMNT